MGKAIKYILIVVALALLLVTFVSALPAVRNSEITKPSATLPEFDHSQCQYPDRTTNPANGCDNSDPCDAAQTKGGSGDCTTIEIPASKVIPAPSIEAAQTVGK